MAENESELTEFVSPMQIAHALKVDPSTVYDWLDRRTLPSIRIGRKTRRIPRRQYEQWLKDRGLKA